MNDKMKNFIIKNNFTDKILVINKMCNVKTIKEHVDLIIPFGYINEFGLISNTQVHLEELLMSIPIDIIKYGNKSIKNEMIKIENNYHIPTELINLDLFNERLTL